MGEIDGRPLAARPPSKLRYSHASLPTPLSKASTGNAKKNILIYSPMLALPVSLSLCLSSPFRRRWVLGVKSPNRRDHVPSGVCAIFYNPVHMVGDSRSAMVEKNTESLSRQQERSPTQPGQPRAEEAKGTKKTCPLTAAEWHPGRTSYWH